MVLFLFVVMMLDINIDSLQQGFLRHFPLALGIGAVISLEMAVVLFKGFAPAVPAVSAASQAAQYSNTKGLGTLLYTEYLYPVEIAAVILLVAMVTAIALALRERKDNKSIDPAQQVHVRARDRFELLKMEPVQPAPAPVQETEAAAPAAQEVKK
jgi:NADH-quinone oxidoreductase subunit J